MKPFLTTAGCAALALALSACELRREGAQETPDTSETDAPVDPGATPEPSQSTPPASSIIREVAVPTPAVEEERAEPVELTLPFPNGSNINATAERRLAGLLREPAIDEDWPVILSGHTDSGGNDQANLRASRARAEAVAAWLVERGIDDDRIEVIAFGEQNPIAPNALPDGTANEQGRRANRRVEIRIAPPEAKAPSDTSTGEDTDQDA